MCYPAYAFNCAFVCVGHPYSFQYIVLVRDDDVLPLPSSHTSLASPNTRGNSIPIPDTRKMKRLEEGAAAVELKSKDLR